MALFLTLPETLFIAMLGLIAAYLLPPAGREMVIPVGIVPGPGAVPGRRCGNGALSAGIGGMCGT